MSHRGHHSWSGKGRIITIAPPQIPDWDESAVRDTHVVIEGLIGAGKTTLLEQLHKEAERTNLDHHVQLAPERVERWCNFGPRRVNLLDRLYREPKRYGATFQHVAIADKIDQLRNIGTIQLTERSLLSQQRVFIPQLYEKNIITEIEKEGLDYTIDSALANYKLYPDVVVYLRIDPKIAKDRIMERGRAEEKDIDIDLLTDLHLSHEKWLMGRTPTLIGEVWMYDVDKEPVDVQELWLRIVHRAGIVPVLQ